MSTVSTTTTHRIDVLHPLVAATVGGTVFAIAMIGGDLFDLNAGEGPPTKAWEIAVYLVLVGAALVLAVWLGVRARAGSPGRLSKTAIALAVASAATFVAFWSGWPHVFGAVAVALALEHRRRVGSFSAATLSALVVGAVSVVAAAYICVVG